MRRCAPVSPRLVYASITGYGSSGPWTKRRAYAPVVGAEAGITKAQGDARGGVYTNDPFSHADVYTALEAATAIVAALYRRERTGEGCWIDVSMAQTMLYVNEHLHDQLYDGDVDPGWIRSFAPGDYLVVSTANGDLVAISGHPAERGTFELFVAAFGLDELAASERFADVATRMENFAELREHIARAAATFADAGALEERLGQYGLAAGKVRDGTRAGRVGVGGRSAGDRVRGRSPRRDDPHPQPAVAVRRRARARSPASRATAARTTAPCSASCSATTTRRSTSSRRPASCRAAAPRPDRDGPRPQGCVSAGVRGQRLLPEPPPAGRSGSAGRPAETLRVPAAGRPIELDRKGSALPIETLSRGRWSRRAAGHRHAAVRRAAAGTAAAGHACRRPAGGRGR